MWIEAIARSVGTAAVTLRKDGCHDVMIRGILDPATATNDVTTKEENANVMNMMTPLP